MPKKFKPSAEVCIEPRRGTDGGETWDISVSATALQRLANLAGVSVGEAAWLRESLEFMLFNVQHDANPVSAPAVSTSWASGLKHLRSIRATSRRLQMLLDAPTKTEMFSFEERELRQQWFGSKALPTAGSMAEAQRFMGALEKIKAGLLEEKQTIDRLFARSSAILDELKSLHERGQRRPAKPSALDTTKQYIADCALLWWTHFGQRDRRSKSFVAFADELYRLAGLRSSEEDHGSRRNQHAPPK
jgi:hypothetical protein